MKKYKTLLTEIENDPVKTAKKVLDDNPELMHKYGWAASILKQHGFKFQTFDFDRDQSQIDIWSKDNHHVMVGKHDWQHWETVGTRWTPHASGFRPNQLASHLQKHFPLKESEENFKKAQKHIRDNPDELIMNKWAEKILKAHGYYFDMEHSIDYGHAEGGDTDTWAKDPGGHTIYTHSNGWEYHRNEKDEHQDGGAKSQLASFLKRKHGALKESDELQDAQQAIKKTPVHSWAIEHLRKHGFQFDTNEAGGRDLYDNWKKDGGIVVVARNKWSVWKSRKDAASVDWDRFETGSPTNLQDYLKRQHPIKESEQEFDKAKRHLQPNPDVLVRHQWASKVARKHGFEYITPKDLGVDDGSNRDFWINDDHILEIDHDTWWHHNQNDASVMDCGAAHTLEPHLKTHFLTESEEDFKKARDELIRKPQHKWVNQRLLDQYGFKFDISTPAISNNHMYDLYSRFIKGDIHRLEIGPHSWWNSGFGMNDKKPADLEAHLKSHYSLKESDEFDQTKKEIVQNPHHAWATDLLKTHGFDYQKSLPLANRVGCWDQYTHADGTKIKAREDSFDHVDADNFYQNNGSGHKDDLPDYLRDRYPRPGTPQFDFKNAQSKIRAAPAHSWAAKLAAKHGFSHFTTHPGALGARGLIDLYHHKNGTALSVWKDHWAHQNAQGYSMASGAPDKLVGYFNPVQESEEAFRKARNYVDDHRDEWEAAHQWPNEILKKHGFKFSHTDYDRQSGYDIPSSAYDHWTKEFDSNDPRFNESHYVVISNRRNKAKGWTHVPHFPAEKQWGTGVDKLDAHLNSYYEKMAESEEFETAKKVVLSEPMHMWEDGEAPGCTTGSTGGTTETTPPESVGKRSFKKFKKTSKRKLRENDDLFKTAQQEANNTPYHMEAVHHFKNAGFVFKDHLLGEGPTMAARSSAVDRWERGQHIIRLFADRSWGHYCAGIRVSGTPTDTPNYRERRMEALVQYLKVHFDSSIKEELDSDVFVKAKHELFAKPYVSDQIPIMEKHGFKWDRVHKAMFFHDVWKKNDSEIHIWNDGSWYHLQGPDEEYVKKAEGKGGNRKELLDSLHQHLGKWFKTMNESEDPIRSAKKELAKKPMFTAHLASHFEKAGFKFVGVQDLDRSTIQTNNAQDKWSDGETYIRVFDDKSWSHRDIASEDILETGGGHSSTHRMRELEKYLEAIK